VHGAAGDRRGRDSLQVGGQERGVLLTLLVLNQDISGIGNRTKQTPTNKFSLCEKHP